MENGAVMTASEHGEATTMARWRGAALCSGAGERRAGRESEMELAAETRGLSFHAGLTGWADASIWPPRSVPGLPQLAIDGAASVAIKPR